MAEKLDTVRLDAPWLGLDTDSAPSAVARAKGLLVQNYLTGDNGRIIQRGAITASPVAYGVANKRVAGVVSGRDRLFIGLKAHDDATRIIEPWVAPYKVSADSTLAKAYPTAIRVVSLGSGSGTLETDITPTDRRYVPGPRFTRYGKYAYFIAYDSENDDAASDADNKGILPNANGGHERKTAILRKDLTSLSSNPVLMQTFPFAAQDIRIHYGMLLVLGGTTPIINGDDVAVGFPHHNRIHYTDFLSADDFNNGINNADAAISIWQDDASAMRVLDLPGSQEDFGVAFAAAGKHLAALKRREIVLLTGYGPDSFQMRTFAQGIGCLDPRSVVEANDGCFFLSAHGYMFFDGVQIKDASKGIHDDLLEAGLAAVGDEGTAGGFAVSERITNDYIMLTIGVADFAASPAAPDVTFCGLYHIPSESWDTFHSNNFASTGKGPIWIGRTENRQFLADHSNLYIATNLTTPNQVAESSRGKDGSNVIETKWHSRTVELAAPFARAQLQRVIVDYTWTVDGGTEEQYTGPTVTIYDASTNTALDTWTLPSGADDGREVARRRYTREVFAEVNELQVRIEYTGTARALVESEILDVFVEYSVAQERHS